MKTHFTSRVGLALFGLMTIALSVSGQFSGEYDPANWSIVQVNSGNGSVNAANAPSSIDLTGPDGLSSQAYTRYQITIPAAGTVSFDWSVIHQDPNYDGFGYWVNTTYTQLTQTTQSGSTSITVSEGDEFAFYGDSFDGCCGTFVATISNFSGPEKAMNDAGVEEIIQPAGNICADSLEVLVMIKNYGANQITPVTVNWSVNGIAQPSVQYTGTLDTAGGSGPDTAQVSLGNYYFLDSIALQVWTSNPNNVNDTANSNDSVLLLFVAPDPEITLNDTSFCEGEFLILEAEAGFASYNWSTGSGAQQIQITQGGTYSLTVTDQTGCQDSASVIISEIPAPSVNLGSDTTACDSLLLNPQVVGTTYIWSTGATTQSIYATSSDFYSVTVQSAEGCLGEDQVQVTVSPSPQVDLGPNFDLCVETGESAVLAAGSGFASYDWNTGETSSNIIVGGFGSSPGNQNYAVTVTSEAGCTGADTVRVSFVNCWPASVQELDDSRFKFFPNPAKYLITIEFEEFEARSIDLVDMNGRIVTQRTGNLSNTEIIDVSNMPSGNYLLRVHSLTGLSVKTLVIE